MKITCQWFDGERPQFNVLLASKDGAEPFMTIKGCRIVDGSKGAFVSWPATKNQSTGKYWNHVYANALFGSHILELAKKDQPVDTSGSSTNAQLARAKPSEDFSADIPF